MTVGKEGLISETIFLLQQSVCLSLLYITSQSKKNKAGEGRDFWIKTSKSGKRKEYLCVCECVCVSQKEIKGKREKDWRPKREIWDDLGRGLLVKRSNLYCHWSAGYCVPLGPLKENWIISWVFNTEECIVLQNLSHFKYFLCY